MSQIHCHDHEHFDVFIESEETNFALKYVINALLKTFLHSV